MAAGVNVAKGADGVFGIDTYYAVQTFQRYHNLAVTGIIDLATARALGFDDPMVNWHDARLGSSGSFVTRAEQALMAAGVNVAKGADGAFGIDNYYAVQTFQRYHNLPVTGIIDVATARALGLFETTATTTAAPASASARTSTSVPSTTTTTTTTTTPSTTTPTDCRTCIGICTDIGVCTVDDHVDHDPVDHDHVDHDTTTSPRPQPQHPPHPTSPRAQPQHPPHPTSPRAQPQHPPHPTSPRAQPQHPPHPTSPRAQPQHPPHPTSPRAQPQHPPHPTSPRAQPQHPPHPTSPRAQPQHPPHPTSPRAQRRQRDVGDPPIGLRLRRTFRGQRGPWRARHAWLDTGDRQPAWSGRDWMATHSDAQLWFANVMARDHALLEGATG